MKRYNSTLIKMTRRLGMAIAALLMFEHNGILLRPGPADIVCIR